MTSSLLADGDIDDPAGTAGLSSWPAAVSVAGGLAVTLRGDDDGAESGGAVLGTGTIPVTWRQLARTLVSVHATDAGSTSEAVRHTADMAMALLRAAGR